MGRQTDSIGARSLVVVGLLLLAGCSGFPPDSGPSEPETTLTPAPVEMETSTPTATPVEGFPGIGQYGLNDLGELVASHRRYLTRRSYTLHWTRHAKGGSGVIGSSYRRRIEVQNASIYSRVEKGTQLPGALRTYKDPSGLYRRIPIANGTFRTQAMLGGAENVNRRYAVFVGNIVDFLIVPGSTETKLVDRDGTQYAVISSQKAPDNLRGIYDDYTLRNYTATIWVHPDGYIRSIYYEFTLLQAGDRIDIQLRYSYDAIGETTVTEPQWVTQIKRNRTNLETARTKTTSVSSVNATATATETSESPAETQSSTAMP